MQYSRKVAGGGIANNTGQYLLLHLMPDMLFYELSILLIEFCLCKKDIPFRSGIPPHKAMHTIDLLEQVVKKQRNGYTTSRWNCCAIMIASTSIYQWVDDN